MHDFSWHVFVLGKKCGMSWHVLAWKPFGDLVADVAWFVAFGSLDVGR